MDKEQAIQKFQEKIDWANQNRYPYVSESDVELYKMAINALAISSAEPKVGHCEDCKCFRKPALRTDIFGKCIQHLGVCPPCNWYCADFEPQESEE